jgi:hypothetical protein
MAKRRRGTPDEMEIEALLQRFASGVMKVGEGEQAIERLRLSKELVLPHLLTMIRDPDQNTHTVAAQILLALEDRNAVRPLLELLDDPTLDDWCKLSIFSVLQHYQAPVDLDALYRRLRDPEAVAYQSLESVLNSFGQAAQLAQFLDTLAEHMPPEGRREMLRRLAEMGDPRALFPLRAALHMPEEAVVLAAIEGLETLRAAVAIPWLDEVARYGSTEMVRQEAGRVAGHLTMRSSVPGADVIHELPPLAESQWPLHSCWLTVIDGAGGQVVFVARERPDGHLALADMMFTDHEGLKDCFGADMMAQEEFEALLHDLGSEGITAVQVSLERSRDVVERAYRKALAVGRQLPLEYFAWGALLAGEDPRPIEEWPVEEVDTTAHPELVGHSIRLLSLVEMASWFFNPEEIQALAEQHRHLLWRPHISRPRLLRMLRQGVESVVDEERRSLLGDRMRRQAWLLSQIYADEEVWQWAMSATASLENREVPLDQHPLLLGMVAASLDNLLGTELADEMLGWDEESWLGIVQATPVPPAVAQPVLSEWTKLCAFLQHADVRIPTGLSGLASADMPRSVLRGFGPMQAALRALNWLESVFDEEIGDYHYDAEGLDWRRLREELGLVPSTAMKSSALQEIEADLLESLESEGCSPAMIARARQLWDDYVLLNQGQVRPMRKPESWAAGMEYLVRLLHFDWNTQEEVGDAYGVSVATVSKRYHALHEELGVRIFSYPSHKDWQVAAELEGWSHLSPEEIAERLFDRFAELSELFPRDDEDWE